MIPASELHRVARRSLRTTLAGLGFRLCHGGARACWARTQDDLVTDVVVRPSAHNFVQERGRFTIDVSEADAIHGRVTNYGLTFLLDDGLRERLREVINEVRRRMPPPDPGILRDLTDSERRWYLSAFAPMAAPLLPSEDVWFEYVDERDAEAAFAFVAEVLPTCLSTLNRVGVQEHARRVAEPTGVATLADAQSLIESIRPPGTRVHR